MFKQLMQGKLNFDYYDSIETVALEEWVFAACIMCTRNINVTL